MRSSLVLAFSLVAALGAAGCKKSDKPADKDPGATTGAPKPATPADAAAAAAVPGADTLKLPESPAKVGDKRVKTDDIVVLFQFDAKGKKIDAKSVEHKQESIEVLAVDGKIPMKIKVSYSGLSAAQTIGAVTNAKPQPLDGKSYLVWFEAGVIKATAADGAAVSAEELKELTDKNDELGKPDVIEELLAARTWKIGETYVLSADELTRVKAQISDPGKPVPAEISFTLSSFDAKEARFAMTTTLIQAKDADKLTFTMKGTARVELPSNRGTEMSMEGSLDGSVKGMATTGTMTAKTTYTY